MEVTSPPGFHFWTDHGAEGNNARIFGNWERQQNDAQIARNQEFTLRFWSHGGIVHIGTRAYRTLPPASTHAMMREGTSLEAGTSAPGRLGPIAGSTRVNPDGTLIWPGDTWGIWGDPPLPPLPPQPPVPPGGGGGGRVHAAVTVKLWAPGIAEPVQVWSLPEELSDLTRTVEYNPQGFPSPDAPIKRTGWWKCSITPVQDTIKVYISARSTFAVVPYRTQIISARLFDTVFRVALEALVPVARIDGSRLKLQVGQELEQAYPGLDFPPPVDVSISPIVSWAHLRSLRINAVSGRQAKQAASQKGRNPPGLASVQDDDIALKIQAVFDNMSASVYGFDIGRLEGDLGEFYLVFDRTFSRCTPCALLDVDFSTLAEWLLRIAALFTEVNHDVINTAIETGLRGYEGPLRTYLREALSRAIAQRGVVDEVKFAGDGWQLKYFVEPAMPDENIVWRPPVGGVGGAGGGVLAGAGTVGPSSGVSGGSGSPSSGGGGPPTPSGEQPGTLPPDEEFIVAGGAPLERLDRHKAIVVVMMENRSYDHLLGCLTAALPRANDTFDGPPPTAQNPRTDGFAAKVPIVETPAIHMGTVTPVCPHHDFASVRFQLGNGDPETKPEHVHEHLGEMQGFTRDVADRTDSPQIVMMQYQESQLPNYLRLANEFMVCTRWFAAHPGPTWPNRYATVTGKIPALDNFDAGDPRIGFLKDYSIWDALTGAGIDWRVFESDLSLVRTFDRYRLDATHVAYINDDHYGLEAVFGSMLPLPRVIFIEPNFTDLPPVATACDDLPPADLALGQAFIARVLDAVCHGPHFKDCLLVITYDEHGGFYDHVPPPGTAKGDPALVDSFAKLHPDGPQHLGVRVPAFIVSPYVDAGIPNHDIFDHTSILKTILVHNRDRLTPSVHAAFGPRVAAAPHLGVALTLDAPRQAPEAPYAIAHGQPPGRPGGRFGAVAVDPTSISTADPGTASGAPGPLPRTVTIVPRPDPEVKTIADPGDFHSALRDLLRPRRT